MQGIMLAYEQIVAHFMRKLADNELKGGDVMPSENECVNTFMVSRGTVRKAYGVLAERGIIRKEAGVGTFVVPNALELLAERENSICSKAVRKKIAVTASSYTAFNQPILDGLYDCFKRNNWLHELFTIDTLEQEHKLMRKLIFEGRYDGLVSVPLHRKDMHLGDFVTVVKSNIPTITIGSPPFGAATNAVYVDDSVTIYEMIRKFSENGCKRVLMLHDSAEGQVVFSDRLRAYYYAKSRFYPSSDEPALEAKTGWEKEIEQIIRDSDKKIGVLLLNINHAKQLFDAIENSGKRLKKDVNVIAYGLERNYPFLGEKTLSVMEIPKYALGKKAAEIMYGLFTAGSLEYTNSIIFPAKYREGDT